MVELEDEYIFEP